MRRTQLRSKISQVLSQLPTKERAVLSLLLGLQGTKASADELAIEFKTSVLRIFELKAQALRLLRRTHSDSYVQ